MTGWLLQLAGVALLSGAAPFIAPMILILAGLLFYEHAHVAAGQSVPLA